MTIKATTKALLGTAVSFALLGTASTSFAADLDNLSDDELLARIERLEKIIGPGDKYAVRSGTNKVRVTLNGQSNNVVRYANDGFDSGVLIGDNNASSNRFRILGEAKLNDKISAGTAFEFDVEDNQSAGRDLFNQENSNERVGAGDLPDFDIRRTEFFFKHVDFGTVTVGQGNRASNGVAENDLSGTGISQDSDSDDLALDFRNSATGALSGFSVGAVGSDFYDVGGRGQRVRYDTPTFAGFSAAVSKGQRANFTAAGRYKAKDLAGFDIAAGVGYAATSIEDSVAVASDVDGAVGGSVSVRHRGTGLSLTGAAGTTTNQETGDTELTAYYVKGGWSGNITGLGSTGIGVSYRHTDASTVGGGDLYDGGWISVLAVQKIDSLSAEIYARYSNYNIDITGGPDTDNINVVAVGSRIKF